MIKYQQEFDYIFECCPYVTNKTELNLNVTYCYKCSVRKKINVVKCYYICPLCYEISGFRYARNYFQNHPYNDKYQQTKKYEYDRCKQFKKKLIRYSFLSDKRKRELNTMFWKIQLPFEHHKESERHNFLRYDYVAIKCMEIIDKKQYTDVFKMPKSKKIIRKYDRIWKKICHELGWTFYPSNTN